MQYRFTDDRDWSDFSTGRVLRSGPGQTAFPARLANEVFRLCVAECERDGRRGPYAVYDPCCGSASLLTEIALLNPQRICRIVASDIDPQALETARNNLGLLTAEGANRRLRQIEADVLAYGKESHREALESARRIRDRVVLDREQRPIDTETLCLDATRLGAQDWRAIGCPDIVLADVPYGMQSDWQIPRDAVATPTQLLLESLLVLPARPVVAIAADKKTRVEHVSYRRLRRFSAGKRQIVLLERTPR